MAYTGNTAERRARYISRLGLLRQEREHHKPHWVSIADYEQPWKGRFFVQSNASDRTNKKIVDNTATLGGRTLASGMMGGITSPARPWFKLEVADPALMENQAVKLWLSGVEQTMRATMQRTNLYNAIHQLYGELGYFSTGGMVIVEDKEKVFRCVPLPIGSYYIACGEEGRVDTLYREFRMTVRQVVERFKTENISDSVLGLYQAQNYDAWVEILHVIEPNDMRNPDKITNVNMPYRSVYLEMGVNATGRDTSQLQTNGPGDKILSESGFEEFIGMFPRWDVNGEDVYGSGAPGTIALGDSKALQVQQKMKAKAIAKMVDPPMNVPSSVEKRGYSIIPGSVNYLDQAANGGVKAEPAHNVNLPINYVLEDIQENQMRIKEAFFVDLFLMIANDNRSNITAREIQEKHEEKLLMLGPVLERLQAELLDPMIDRIFGIMSRAGLFEEPPEEIQGTDLKVEYVSVMAQAQKLVGVGSIERLASFVGNMAGADPTVMDKFDSDQAVDEYAKAVSAPPKLVRPDEEVGYIRETRAAQEQAAQQAQNNQANAQGAKLLSETDVEGDNGLTELMREMGLG